MPLRIGAKHQELRQKQARGLLEYYTSPGGPPPDMEDDDTDPNYARVNHFREMQPVVNAYRSASPSVPETAGCDHSPALVDRDHLEGIYAKIKKPFHQQAPLER